MRERLLISTYFKVTSDEWTTLQSTNMTFLSDQIHAIQDLEFGSTSLWRMLNKTRLKNNLFFVYQILE